MEHFPAFIVGCYRTGTTLLRLLLDSHSLIAIPEETRLVWNYYNQWQGTIPDVTYLEEVLGKESVEEFKRLPDERKQDLHSLLTVLLGDYAARHGKKYWGEKTPIHAEYINEIAETFPEATIFCMVRDPRAVVESGKHWYAHYNERKRWWMTKDSDFILKNWRERLEIGLRHQHRVFFVRYEKLVSQPEETLKAICIQLGISFEPQMLHHHEFIRERGDNLTNREWHKEAANPINSTHVDKWKRGLSLAEIRSIEARSEPYFSTFGYTPYEPSAE